MSRYSLYNRLIKPFFDIIISIILMLLTSPIWLIIILILVIDGNGILFKHKRPGLEGRIFELMKFKTMTNGEITRFGGFLRKSSLDEIPQLVNVLKGEMSLIGPRPLLESYLDLYDEHEKRRHLVKPGITGWAQVNGRNALSLREKVSLDLYYVDHLSWKLDFLILSKTFFQLFKWTQADFHNQNQ